MGERKEFQMTDEEHREILDACKPVVAIKVGNHWPSSPQENANRAWQALGKKRGFKWDTVKPLPSKGDKYFTAEEI